MTTSRFALSALAALLCASSALAQEAPASQPAKKSDAPPRISVESKITLDGKAEEKSNKLQYFVYSQFNSLARFRVDSKTEVGIKAADKYIAKMDRFWQKEDPGNTHPVTFRLQITQTVRYDASKFYGEAQAHNFHGEIKAVLSKPDGTELKTWSFPLNWGRLISSGLSKSQVRDRYDQRVYTALVLALLNDPTIHGKIAPKRHGKILKWSQEMKAQLKKFLDGSTKALAEGEMAKFVDGVKLQGEAKK